MMSGNGGGLQRKNARGSQIPDTNDNKTQRKDQMGSWAEGLRFKEARRGVVRVRVAKTRSEAGIQVWLKYQ